MLEELLACYHRFIYRDNNVHSRISQSKFVSRHVIVPPFRPFLSITIRRDWYAKEETSSGASFNGFHKRRSVFACIRAGPFPRYQMSSSSSSSCERSRKIAVTREIPSSKFQTFSCGTASTSALLERQSRWTAVMDSNPTHAIIIMDVLHGDMTWFCSFWCGTNDERRERVCYNSLHVEHWASAFRRAIVRSKRPPCVAIARGIHAWMLLATH